MRVAVRSFLAALLAAVATGCGSHAASFENGKKIYATRCSACHQIDGRGYDQVFPNLAGNPIVQLPDPDPVIDTVVRGRGSMQPFGPELKDEDLAAVITYIRGAWNNHAPPVSPTQVR